VRSISSVVAKASSGFALGARGMTLFSLIVFVGPDLASAAAEAAHKVRVNAPLPGFDGTTVAAGPFLR